MSDGREIDHTVDEIGSRMVQISITDRSEIGQVGVNNKPCEELTDGSIVTDLSTANRLTDNLVIIKYYNALKLKHTYVW